MVRYTRAAATKQLGQFAGGQIDFYGIEAGWSAGRDLAARAQYENEIDLQVLGVHGNVQIAVSAGGLDERVISVDLTGGLADSLVIVTSAAGNDVRH